MSAHISLITLGVGDVAKATAFYERLGFVKSKNASQDEVSFLQAGGVVLAIWSREAQLDDARRTRSGPAMAEWWWLKMSRANATSMR